MKGATLWENIANLSQLPFLLLTIGSAAVIAAGGLANYNAQAYHTFQASKNLQMSMKPQEQTIKIDYTQMKKAVKDALKESKLIAIVDNINIESTPVYLCEKKFGTIVHKAIKATQ